MKYYLLSFTFLVVHFLHGQSDLGTHAVVGNLENLSIVESLPELIDNDLIFYGFLHGAEMPQKVDAQLVIELMQVGVKYYAPEVSMSGAYFLNKYLSTGEEKFLLFVLQSYAAPQDASVQWIEKYRKIYEFNESLAKEDRLSIIGTDRESSISLKIAHLSHLLPASSTGVSIIDSLSLFQDVAPELHYISGAPLWKVSNKYNLSYDDILYTKNSPYQFSKRFITYYENNTDEVLAAFDANRDEVVSLLTNQTEDRESVITFNFETQVIPIVQGGEKVYCNFGFAHVLQESYSDYLYLAGRIKKAYPDLKIYSILTQMADCKVLEKGEVCLDKKIVRYGKTIKLAKVCGAVISDELDGDTKNEKVLGIEELKQVTPLGEMAILDISTLTNAQLEKQYFIGYELGKNADDIQLDPSKSTDAYFQALIFIRGSDANVPYELMSN